jgi:riboflavin synthase
MFSGIVEETARVKGIRSKKDGLQLTIESKSVAKDVKVGDSICVNGVCLSIVKASPGILTFDVMEETLRKTNLRRLMRYSYVNLERSLLVGERISGHFVTGHIDSIGVITAINRRADDFCIDIELPKGKMIYVVEKGSVAVDGVSLTVGEVTGNHIKIYLIPLTRKATILGSKHVGEEVNIEFDILGKYEIKRSAGKKSIIDEQFLRRHGYV